MRIGKLLACAEAGMEYSGNELATVMRTLSKTASVSEWALDSNVLTIEQSLCCRLTVGNKSTVQNFQRRRN